MATVKRFPREPKSGGYIPTATEINSSGDYEYNVHPVNVVFEDPSDTVLINNIGR